MQISENERIKLEKIAKDYSRLVDLLSYEEVLLDKKLCVKYMKDKASIEPVAIAYQSYLQAEKELKEIGEIITHLNISEKMEYVAEQDRLKECQDTRVLNLQKLLFEIESEYQEIVIEIIPLKNGLSEILSKDIINGYSRFCDKHDLKFRFLDNKNIQLQIIGLGTKDLFIHEVGIHVATKNGLEGTCQVFVYDKCNIEDVTFNDDDLSITICRSSGAGGQHINTTDSAIKITHLKTGISVTCQDERSQLQNKQKAIENLKMKVNDFIESQRNQFYKNQKKEQMKLMKSCVKLYDYNLNSITKADKQMISLDDFLQGTNI